MFAQNVGTVETASGLTIVRTRTEDNQDVTMRVYETSCIDIAIGERTFHDCAVFAERGMLMIDADADGFIQYRFPMSEHACRLIDAFRAV